MMCARSMIELGSMIWYDALLSLVNITYLNAIFTWRVSVLKGLPSTSAAAPVAVACMK